MNKAIILAAGKGCRLGELTNSRPKPLLPIGDKMLLDYSLEAIFEKTDIREVLIVIGYLGEQIKERYGRQYKGIKIKYIDNQEYETKNNIYSLWLGKDEILDGFLLLNSDIIYDWRILERAYKCEHQDIMVIDDSVVLAEEEMKVRLEDGIIKEINKKIHSKDGHGEYIGIMKFSGAASTRLMDKIDEMVKKGITSVYYEDAINEILSECSVYGFSTQALAWTEIDTEEDYDYAKTEVYSAINVCKF